MTTLTFPLLINLKNSYAVISGMMLLIFHISLTLIQIYYGGQLFNAVREVSNNNKLEQESLELMIMSNCNCTFNLFLTARLCKMQKLVFYINQHLLC